MSDITFKHHDPNVMLELWHVTKPVSYTHLTLPTIA